MLACRMAWGLNIEEPRGLGYLAVCFVDVSIEARSGLGLCIGGTRIASDSCMY